MAAYQKKDFNFYKRYHQKPARKWGFWPIYNIILVLCILLASGTSYWLFSQNRNVQKQVDALEQEYLANPLALAAQSEIRTLREELLEANTQAANLMAAFSAIESYPKANYSLIQQIFSLAGEGITLRFSSYQAQNGVFDLAAEAHHVNLIPGFIQRLEDSGLFEGVTYTGYGFNNEKYNIFFQCVLHNSAGKGVLE